MSKIVLGIDPGIANTGIGVVTHDKLEYKLKLQTVIRTLASDSFGKRLSIIQRAIKELLKGNLANVPCVIDAIAVEKVYHNRNIKSSMTTAAVIGQIHLIGYKHKIPVYEYTPQQVKRASGLGPNIGKEQIIRIANGIFTSEFQTHHAADAAMCGLCCLLELNTKMEV